MMVSDNDSKKRLALAQICSAVTHVYRIQMPVEHFSALLDMHPSVLPCPPRSNFVCGAVRVHLKLVLISSQYSNTKYKISELVYAAWHPDNNIKFC